MVFAYFFSKCFNIPQIMYFYTKALYPQAGIFQICTSFAVKEHSFSLAGSAPAHGGELPASVQVRQPARLQRRVHEGIAAPFYLLVKQTNHSRMRLNRYELILFVQVDADTCSSLLSFLKTIEFKFNICFSKSCFLPHSTLDRQIYLKKIKGYRLFVSSIYTCTMYIYIFQVVYNTPSTELKLYGCKGMTAIYDLSNKSGLAFAFSKQLSQ